MRRRPLRVAMSAAAGSWRASRPGVILGRVESPPMSSFRRLITVPVGNDGIAARALFGAGGAAQSQVGPSGVGASWSLDQANVYTDIGALDGATAQLFVGPLPFAQYQVAALLAGGGAQVALGGISLDPGWFVWAVWAGGTPGAHGFLYVVGAKTVLVQ